MFSTGVAITCPLFTFHCDSVHRHLPSFPPRRSSDLHSTMFLLILLQLLSLMFSRFSLHSTMFLLIRRFWIATTYLHRSLHSTMFLLILFKTNCFPIRTNFTFHDVSINTLETRKRLEILVSLHSTMFLLILQFLA